ncbi:MAG: 4Fe-4S dicluster domain-containing protein [Gemmatimonadaceae bacterium]|nr:4Fe-4S dicluster domain-containing protein [Gemmatimonadaceae bacterium]
MTLPLQQSPLGQAKAGLDACVHCGFCLQACPTYVNLGDENDSPRGRLVLMRRMLDGEIALTDDAATKHIDQCLGCRGCETACPSGVPYGHLLEATRATIAQQRPIPIIARAVLSVFNNHTILHLALRAARLFRDTGLPKALARVLPQRLAFPLAMLASTKPRSTSSRSKSSRSTSSRSTQEQEPSAALLTGCVMQGLFPHVHQATEKTLRANHHTIKQVPTQRCCGALHAHAGDLASARSLAKQNIAAFEQSSVDVIVVNSAGCAAMMKDYAHLLSDDPVWKSRAARVSAKVRDVSEVLASHGPTPGSQPVTLRVTHDAPCHQQHAQRITAPPLTVLKSIPGLTLVPLEDSDQCCGAAGIYNLIEPDVSDRVLAPKLQRIADTKAQIVATGNPGCMMQIGAGLLLSGSDARVMHPVELLAESYPD